MYEGRTRGKRMKYTYSEGEDDDNSTSDAGEALGTRRSTRNVGMPTGPQVTSSGRQVRTRFGNLYGSAGENSASRQSPATERSDTSEDIDGRPSRSGGTLDAWANGKAHVEGYNEVDEMDEEDDAVSSGEEWHGEDEMDDRPEDEDEDLSEASDEDMEPRSLVVKLQYKKAETSISQPLRPATPRKDNPDLAYRTNLTPTSSKPATKVFDAAPLSISNLVSPVGPAVPSSNGVSNGPQASTEARASNMATQPILPSFSKFLYNPASNDSAMTGTSNNAVSTSSLPTPPASGTVQQSEHRREW
jgi:hypothetical protein